MREFFKHVVGYEAAYEVSTHGTVVSLPRPVRTKTPGVYKITKRRTLRWFYDRDGYPFVTLSVLGVSKTIKVHRLVALTFLPNPESKPCVMHLNNDPSDPLVTNLQWGSRKENEEHKTKCGRRASGYELSRAIKQGQSKRREMGLHVGRPRGSKDLRKRKPRNSLCHSVPQASDEHTRKWKEDVDDKQVNVYRERKGGK